MNVDSIIRKLSSTPRENILDVLVDELYKNFNHYNWVGVYILKDNLLVLYTWRGEEETPHTSIPIGEGVCGFAAVSGETEIVPDVSKDDRYLSCFQTTRSEIVVPIKKDDKVIGEIDIDSNELDAFSEKDKELLERVASNPLVISAVEELLT